MINLQLGGSPCVKFLPKGKKNPTNQCWEHPLVDCSPPHSGSSGGPRAACRDSLSALNTQKPASLDPCTAIVQFNRLLIKNELFWPLSHDGVFEGNRSPGSFTVSWTEITAGSAGNERDYSHTENKRPQSLCWDTEWLQDSGPLYNNAWR